MIFAARLHGAHVKGAFVSEAKPSARSPDRRRATSENPPMDSIILPRARRRQQPPEQRAPPQLHFHILPAAHTFGLSVALSQHLASVRRGPLQVLGQARFEKPATALGAASCSLASPSRLYHCLPLEENAMTRF